MNQVLPHQDENMYYLAQSYFLKELNAGRLTVYDQLLAPENASVVFFEDD